MYENIANLPHIQAEINNANDEINELKREEIDRFKYIMQNPKNKNVKKFCIEVFKQRWVLISKQIMTRKQKTLELMIKEFNEMLEESSQKTAYNIIKEGIEICENAQPINDDKLLEDVEEIKEEFVNNTRIVRSSTYPSLWILAMSNHGEKRFKCAYVGANMYGCKDCKGLLADFYLYGDCEQIDSDVVKGVDMLIELAFEGNHQPSINQLGGIIEDKHDCGWGSFITPEQKEKLSSIIRVNPKDPSPLPEYKIQSTKIQNKETI